MSPALAGGFLTTAPPGKSLTFSLNSLGPSGLSHWLPHPVPLLAPAAFQAPSSCPLVSEVLGSGLPGFHCTDSHSHCRWQPPTNPPDTSIPQPHPQTYPRPKLSLLPNYPCACPPPASRSSPRPPHCSRPGALWRRPPPSLCFLFVHGPSAFTSLPTPLNLWSADPVTLCSMSVLS